MVPKGKTYIIKYVVKEGEWDRNVITVYVYIKVVKTVVREGGDTLNNKINI
jgi:hypothetical protein